MPTCRSFGTPILGCLVALWAADAGAVQVGQPANAGSHEPALTPQQAMLWKYTARCALRADQELESPPGPDGATFKFKGALGLAPQWREGKCDGACQEKVSSCLAALTNQTGDHVNLSLLSAAPSLKDALSANDNDLAYPYQEGAFFGNVFAGEAYACRGRDADKGAQLKRFCALAPALCSGIATFADAGSCADSCQLSCTTLSDGTERCAAVSCRDPRGRVWAHPITTYLRNRIEAGNADQVAGAVSRDSALEHMQDRGAALYRHVDFGQAGKPARTFVANVLVPSGGGRIEVWLAGSRRLGVLPVRGSGGVYKDLETPIDTAGLQGQHDIVLRFQGLRPGTRLREISLR
jgi:hypothetical protein